MQPQQQQTTNQADWLAADLYSGSHCLLALRLSPCEPVVCLSVCLRPSRPPAADNLQNIGRR